MNTAALIFRLSLCAGLALAAAVASRAEDDEYHPARILVAAEIAYPAQLSDRIIDAGEAQVMLHISPEGKLVDWFVVGFSHPLFAKAVLDSLPGWQFQPGRRGERSVDARMELKVSFVGAGAVNFVHNDMETGNRRKLYVGEEAVWKQVCKKDELDRPLELAVETAPMPPEQLGAGDKGGKVVVDYFIDTDGRVRMPIVITSDDEGFTRSVLIALSDWRYEVPTRGGFPVLVRECREFTFTRVK